MPILKIVQNGIIKVVAFEGEKPLGDLLGLSDIHIDKPCGGRGTCKKCTVLVDGREELACRYVVRCDAEVVVPETKDIVSVTGADESGKRTENHCICLDIGTTTLALALVSLDDKSIIKAKTAPNPQREVGADVISRIEYCSKNGVGKLQSMLVARVLQMAEELLAEYKVASVEKMYVAGNTTMLHLFFGVDCSSLGVSPYTPTFLEEKRVKGTVLGFENVGEVIALPGISAFVGADIVSGLGFVDRPKADRYSLLIDLGTNAEIVLFDKDKYLCATAAAGPCFEGANISCGMSATVGAVSKYKADGGYSVIGDAEPVGICATGLVDIIAELVRNGTVEESGYMDEVFTLSERVKVTPADIREFQLAKSAVLSAIECLLQHGNVTYSDIETMYIAGGFSAQLNIENAAYLGLVPRELADRFVPINNASLLGTVKTACEGSDLAEIAKRAEFIDLGADSVFSELFFKNMSFGSEEF